MVDYVEPSVLLIQVVALFTQRETADISARFGLIYKKTQFFTENDYF